MPYDAEIDCLPNDRLSFVPYRLRCEYAADPVGIDAAAPAFSWCFPPSVGSRLQSAYRIQVSLGAAEFDRGSLVWDSGMVPSSDCTCIVCRGMELSSRKRYWWRVMAWDEKGEMGAFSEPSFFETGLLHAGDWKGDWIGLAFGHVSRAYIVRRSIDLDGKVAKARAYVCGLGYCELWVNGRKMGDSVLDPGNTDYAKRALYVTHVLDGAFTTSRNVVAAHIGKGWYGNPALLMQIEIEFEDGTAATICTRPLEWDVLFSPVLESQVYQGETYDARLEYDGSYLPVTSYEAETKRRYWQINVSRPYELCGDQRIWCKYPAMLLPPPAGALQAQAIEPIKVMGELAAQAVSSPAEGVYVFDFGQNFSGWANLRVCGEEGTEITLKYSELLREDGSVNMEYLGVAENTGRMQTDRYILKGRGVEEYSPRFTYHGFRYVQVEGFPGIPTKESLGGCVVHTSVAPSGTFSCGNALLNKIHECVTWSERSNLFSIMTDCPQRDERQGWLNDLTARAEEAAYNYHMERMFAKFSEDIADTQDPRTGSIADTAPFRRAQNPADPVCSSYLLLPWLSYLFYGNRKILEDRYDGMKRWTEYLYSMTDEGIVIYSYWGDWASPVNECYEGVPQSKNTPGHLISTAYLFYDLTLMAKIAGVLGKRGEAETFRAYALKTGEAFNRTYFDGKTSNYASGSQGANAIALYMGLAPEESIPAIAENLAYDVMERHNGHLSTGNLCTKYLLEMLTEYGYVDVAYAIATKEDYPGWGYMISNGATTVWERWEYMTGAAMNSHNHAMYGSIDAWFYKYLAGIAPDECAPGFAHVLIKPHVPRHLGSAEASLDTVRGRIFSGWKKTDDGIEFMVELPPNATGVISMPVMGLTDRMTLLEDGRLIWRGGSAQDERLSGDATLSGGRISVDICPGIHQFSMFIS